MDDEIFYGRDGKPLEGGMSEWGKFHADSNYKIIKQEYTADHKYWVSTVWLGLDHSFGGTIPVIFETMVFGAEANKDGFRPDYATSRYSTEQQALAGHAELLKHWTQHEQKSLKRKT